MDRHENAWQPDNRQGWLGRQPTAIIIEMCQAVFVGLAAAVLVYEGRRKGRTEIMDSSFQPAAHRQKTAIIAGIVVALVLIGAFALPAAMPRPSGPPP